MIRAGKLCENIGVAEEVKSAGSFRLSRLGGSIAQVFCPVKSLLRDICLAPITRPRNGENKVQPDGCGRPLSEHEVLFFRRAIVETLMRSLLAVEDSGSVSRQLQFLELNQGRMNLLFARQLTDCPTAFNRLRPNSELAGRRVSPPFLDHRTSPSTGLVTCSIVHLSLWSSFWGQAQPAFFLVYGWPQSLDHEKGKIRCIQTDAAGSDQSTKCSSAGVR